MLLILRCSDDWLSYLKVWSHCIFIFSPEIRGTCHVLCVCICTPQDLKAGSLVYQFTTGTWFIDNIWCLRHEEIVLGLYHFYHRRTLKSVWSREESILRHYSFFFSSVQYALVVQHEYLQSLVLVLKIRFLYEKSFEKKCFLFTH